MAKKLTIQLSDRLSAALEQIAEGEEVSQAHVLRRAIALYKLVDDERRVGHKLAITDETDHVVKEILT